MRRGMPSLLSTDPRKSGFLFAAIASLYLRQRYNKPLALVKNLFALYRGHPIAQETTSSVTRQAGRDSSAVPSQPPISYSPAVQPCSLVSSICVVLASSRGGWLLSIVCIGSSVHHVQCPSEEGMLIFQELVGFIGQFSASKALSGGSREGAALYVKD